jgi:hypothetical protein
VKKYILGFIILLVLAVAFPACATVRFGVGLQWLGNTDMAVGFDLGGGSKTLGIDVSHYGFQPTLHSFGTVELSQNRIGVYYLPWDFLMLQAGLHNTVLNLSQDKEEILGTKRSVNWSGLYTVISFPIRVEETYFIKPFYGIFIVDNNQRTETAWGIAIGADFEVQGDQKILF